MKIFSLLFLLLLLPAIGFGQSGVSLPPITTSSLNGIIFLDNVKYPQTDAGLTAALSAAGAGGTVVIPPAVSIPLSSQHALSSVTIWCQPGAGFTWSSASGYFSVTNASDVSIQYCTFTSASTPGNVIDIANTASRIHIEHDIFNGTYPSASNAILRIGDRSNTTSGTAVTDVYIRDDHFNGFDAGGAVNLQDFVSRVHVEDNIVISGPSSASAPILNAQLSDNSTTLDSLTFSRNLIVNGMANNCIQVQILGSVTGGNIYDTNVSNNTCKLSTTGGHGNASGYSVVGLSGGTFTGNIFDTAGQTYAGGNAPYEFAIVSGTITGNSATMYTQSGAPGAVYSFDQYASQNTVFSDNAASEVYTGTGGSGSAGCIFMGGNPGVNFLRNILKNNDCDFTGSTGKVYGIWLQTNNASANISQNEITHNNIYGTNVTGDGGIGLENDSGTMQNNIVGPNFVYNFHLPYFQSMVGQTANLPSAALTSYSIPINESLTIGAGDGITNSGAGGTLTAGGGTCSMVSGTSCTASVPSGFADCVATVQGATAIAGACGISGTTLTVTAATSNSDTWAFTIIK